MKSLPFAAVLLIAAAASADDLTTRAAVAYQSYDNDGSATSGFHQTYDIGLERLISPPLHIRAFFRAEDFRGATESIAARTRSHFTQLQPSGEMAFNLEKFGLQARDEYLRTRSDAGDFQSSRSVRRTTGQLSWRPDGLPVLTINGQRNRTLNEAAKTDLTDNIVGATLSYDWKGAHGAIFDHSLRSTDARVGYERISNDHGAELEYAGSWLNGRLSTTAAGTAVLTRFTDSSLTGQATAVPAPVSIARALYAIDDTPLDDRDHPLTPNPALLDRDLSASAGISFGPESASYQNIALDLGRFDRVDEIRVVVRDAAGNPVRAGGAVTFDVYTSQDGLLWTPLPASALTSFDIALSLYSIAFDLQNGRWFKVVSFGVNAEPTFATEVQAWYHTSVAGGGSVRTDQRVYNATTNIAFRPTDRLTLSYGGMIDATRQQALTSTTSSDVEHMLTAQYDLLRTLSLRGQYLKRQVQLFTGSEEMTDGVTASLRFFPTRQFEIQLEEGREEQTLLGTAFVLDTTVLHTNARILPSVDLLLDVGRQTQTEPNAPKGERRFVNGYLTVGLAPAWRLLLTAAMQRNNSPSSTELVPLLGPTRDDRVTAEIAYRPGRPLTVNVRIGRVIGQTVSAFTEQVHVDWYPFADGAVSIGGTFDEDIDPYSNRRSARTMFTPRWRMNRFVVFDVNYTAVNSRTDRGASRQKNIFATLTVTR